MSDAHSIPIIPLWGQLIVSLQGIIADHQAAQLTSDVLGTIERQGAEGLVLDVSGVALLDSHLCSVLARLAQSAALMGTRSVICGMSAEVVMTLLAMDVTLDTVETALSLEEALAYLGIRVSRTPLSPHSSGVPTPDELDALDPAPVNVA